MADDMLPKNKNEFIKEDNKTARASEVKLNETIGKGFEITGKVLKEGINASAEKKLSKLEKKNEKLKNGDFHKNDSSFSKHIYGNHHSRKAVFTSEEKGRKKELKQLQKKRNLTNAEASELKGLEIKESKAKAEAKLERANDSTAKAMGKLPEYKIEKDAWGNKSLVVSKQQKAKNELETLKKKKATGSLSREDGARLKQLEKKYGNKQEGNAAKKGGVVKAVSKQAGAFADSVLKGDGTNLGTESALAVKKGVKGTYDFLSGTTKSIKQGVQQHKLKKEVKARKKAKKKEKKEVLKSRYKEFLDEHKAKQALKPPGEREKLTARQKLVAKRQIKKNYAAELRAKEGHPLDTQKLKKKFAKKKEEAIASLKKKIKGVLVIGAAVIAFVIILIVITAMFGGGAVTSTMTYAAERTDIEQAEEYISLLELSLEEEIKNIKNIEPFTGYDEYNGNVCEIGHNANELINYLATIHFNDGYTFEGSEEELINLFHEMYEFTYTTRVETRQTTMTIQTSVVVVSYDVTILDYTLTRKELQDIVSETFDSEQEEVYEMYQASGGLMQIFQSPLQMDWQNSIGRGYGSVRNSSNGNIENHKGIDINVPIGTDVYSGVMNGVVTTVAYNPDYGNYVCIKKDSDGCVIKFAHLSNVCVSVGDKVNNKTIIGQTGDTGSECNGMSQIHIETIDSDGNYMNPIFAIKSEFETISDHFARTTTPTPIPVSPPPSSRKDLVDFAKQFINKPYVWDSEDPNEGFDNIGFITYCVRESGTYPMYRSTAQGLYELYCTPIAPEDAQRNDLIFFKETLDADGDEITYVGIYCGEGIMISAGDPVQFSNINTQYYTQHLYGYGRIKEE